MARVKEIWRYPVKSMIGERVEETALGERGVTGDRAWIIRDEKSGAICGAVVRLAMACPRCVMVTRELPDLSRDPDIMRALVRETKGNLGIGASVEKPGSIREQDAFALLE